MRAFLAGFMGLWLGAYPALAMLQVNQLHGFNATGGGAAAVPKSLNFIGCGNNGGSFDMGVEDASRLTIVAVFAEDNATVFTIDGVTVGGEAASSVVVNSGTALLTETAIFQFANPTGGSEAVSATFSEGITEADVCVYTAYSLDSQTAKDTGSNGDSTAGNLNPSLTVDAGDVVVMACMSESTTGTVSFDLTQDDATDATNFGKVVGSEFPAAGSEDNPSCDWSGTTEDVAAVVATWQ